MNKDDPFGYRAETERREAEDREAEELLDGMVASEPEEFVRELIGGRRAAGISDSTVGEYGDTAQYVRQLLSGLSTGIPPDGPYDPEDLEVIQEPDNPN